MNFFAGILFSLEFIFPKAWIIKVNNITNIAIFYLKTEFLSTPKSLYLIGMIYIIVVSTMFYLIHQAALWLVAKAEFNNAIFMEILTIILLFEWVFLIFFVAVPLLVPIVLIILRLLTISPKGVIGTIGLFLYLLGNALQFWDTLK